MILRRSIQFGASTCCLVFAACDPLEPCLTGLNTGDVILVEIGEQLPLGEVDESNWKPEECASDYPLQDALIRLFVEEFSDSRNCRSGYGSLTGLEGMNLVSTSEPNFRGRGHFFDESYTYQLSMNGQTGFLRLGLWADSIPPVNTESDFAGYLNISITPDQPASTNSCKLQFAVTMRTESP